MHIDAGSAALLYALRWMVRSSRVSADVFPIRLGHATQLIMRFDFRRTGAVSRRGKS